MEPLRFRYRRAGWEQESFRLFANRGEVRELSLLLDRREILFQSIVGTAMSGNELVISVMTPNGRDDVHIAVASGRLRGATFSSGASNAVAVKKTIDGLCSRARFEQRRQELAGSAPEIELRSETCPHCNALVDLSGFPPSPQVFCACCGAERTCIATPTPSWWSADVVSPKSFKLGRFGALDGARARQNPHSGGRRFGLESRRVPGRSATARTALSSLVLHVLSTQLVRGFSGPRLARKVHVVVDFLHVIAIV
jgi:hypothetical protein